MHEAKINTNIKGETMKGLNQKGEGEFALIIGIWIIASWLTHVVVCLSGAKWGFLIAGAIVFPIANIHGTGIWLGLW